jgi:DNA-binding NarL/FixJ family response regulator
VTTADRRPPIRVLIADDQRVVRDGLAMLVGLIDGVEIADVACDGEEAVRLTMTHRPDVVLMDLRMPGIDGITATAQLRERLPSARVLVLTTYADDDTILPALRAGAQGYLTKDASAEQIEAAIRAVHAGQTHLDPLVQERLVATITAGPPPVQAGGAEGLSNTEIAQRLYVSNATVKTHINRIFAKTGARDRAQAVRYAYRAGLASPPA